MARAGAMVDRGFDLVDESMDIVRCWREAAEKDRAALGEAMKELAWVRYSKAAEMFRFCEDLLKFETEITPFIQLHISRKRDQAKLLMEEAEEAEESDSR